MADRALCLDIGSGTQDVFYALPDLEAENCPKIRPADTGPPGGQTTGRTDRRRPSRVSRRPQHGRRLFKAFQAHLKAGLPIALHPDAVWALTDDPERLAATTAAVITHTRPAGYATIFLSDFDPGFWRAFLAAAGLPEPDVVMAAAQTMACIRAKAAASAASPSGNASCSRPAAIPRDSSTPHRPRN